MKMLQVTKRVMNVGSLLICASSTMQFGAPIKLPKLPTASDVKQTIQEYKAKLPSVSRVQQTLEEYGAKMQSSISKITDCLQGKATCTPKEIRTARTYAGIVSAALLVLSATGVGIKVATREKKEGVPITVPEVLEFTPVNFSTNVTDMNETVLKEYVGKFSTLKVGDITMQQWVENNWNQLLEGVQKKLQTAGFKLSTQGGQPGGESAK